mgnify:CR=1 FL=1
MDGMLTQEEIDALTGGNNSDSSTQQASGPNPCARALPVV